MSATIFILRPPASSGRRQPDDPPCQVLILPDLRSPWVIGLAEADAARTPAQIEIDRLLRQRKAEAWDALRHHFDAMDLFVGRLDASDFDLASTRFRLDGEGRLIDGHHRAEAARRMGFSVRIDPGSKSE